MAHFNLRQGLFQSKGELAKYICDGGKEYIPYDYSFDEDILPAINNLLSNTQKVEIKRELKNIKVFLQGDGIGICFQNFDFDSVDSTGLLFGTTNCPNISALYFINCRFNISDGIDVPPYGVAYYDCVFNERFYVNTRIGDTPDSPVEFNNCVFNSLLSFNNVADCIPIEIDRCIFNENSKLDMSRFNRNNETSLYHIDIRNTIFKGAVAFDGATIPERSVFEYLTFFGDVNFKDTEILEQVTWKNLSFSPFISKSAKDGFKSFTTALNKNGYSKEAKFYEQNVGSEAIEKKIDKDRLDIAMKSDWVSIKQAAEILGISYTTLLAMRKEDKADGIMRIPYRGEGKNTRYYVPILKAYKSKDMDLVRKLEKEIG